MRYPLYAVLALGLFATGCEPDTLTQTRVTTEAEAHVLADQGNLEARANLAILNWARGEADSVEQLAVVANDGSASAARALVAAYQGGIVAEQDFSQAAHWLGVAADLGDAKAVRELDYYNAFVQA